MSLRAYRIEATLLKLKHPDEQPFTVSGKLVKAVEFRKTGKWTKVSAGAEIVIDMDTNIALIEGSHVQLDIDDFIVFMQN